MMLCLYVYVLLYVFMFLFYVLCVRFVFHALCFMCLFFVLKELGYSIELAHCNFNLRANESDEDEVFEAGEFEGFCITSFISTNSASISSPNLSPSTF